MKTKRSIIFSLILFLTAAVGYAQVPYGEIVPDVKYHVGGQSKPSRLSNDDVLFTILAFEDDREPGGELPLWYTDQSIQPYFQNYNPDYGRTLMVVTSMKNRKVVERKLGVKSYPEYILVGPDRRVLTRSGRFEDIIKYVTTNLSAYAQTDWAAYLLKAKDLFESGQEFAAQRIVSDCLNHARWVDDFPLEVHKVIPKIVASMEHGNTFDEEYMFFVAEIKHRYNQGILSEEDVAPFKNQFSMIHMMGDKD